MIATARIALAQSEPEWFISWFDSPHYHRLYAHRDEIEAVAFVDRLIRRLEPRDGAACSTWDAAAGGMRVAWRRVDSRSPGSTCRPRAWRAHDAAAGRTSATSSRICAAVRPNVRLRLQPVHELRVFRDQRSHDRDPQHRQVVETRRNGGPRLSQCASRREASRRQRNHRTRRCALRLSRWSDGRAFFKRITIDEGAAAAPRIRRARREADAEDLQRMFACAACASRRPTAITSWAIRCGDIAATDPGGGNRGDAGDRYRAGQVLADAAQRLGRHAQIRREHRLRNAHHDRRDRWRGTRDSALRRWR